MLFSRMVADVDGGGRVALGGGGGGGDQPQVRPERTQRAVHAGVAYISYLG